MKLGGSLLNLDCLVERLSLAIDDLSAPILVIGGGAAAEHVRNWHRAGWLNDSEAHWHAIAAMSFNASNLVESSRPLALVGSLTQAEATLQSGRVPVLDVLAVMKAVESGYEGQPPLPNSWGVTSDSIAAWLSGCLHGRLRLLKSVNAGPNPTQHLDRYFPHAAVHLEHVEWINLRADKPVLEVVQRCAWLATGTAGGTGTSSGDPGDSIEVKAASG